MFAPRHEVLDMPEYQGNRVIASETEARAGVTGQHVRTVLALSTLGAIGAFVAIYVYFFA
jgi:hypothetical protein